MIITSEDVLHDLYFPSFRVKTDAIPGRYTQVWFNATKPGTYHIFCAEYCGTRHSAMIGTVVVMTPEDYEAWLARRRHRRHARAARREAVHAARLRHVSHGRRHAARARS